MKRESPFDIPNAIELGKLITIPGTTKKIKLKTVSRWSWISAKSVAKHEAFHVATAPHKVNRVQCDPDADSQGKTFFDGPFDPIMAAAPAAFGCGGCAGDHHATVTHNFSWEGSQKGARAELHGKIELVELIASALEEDRVLLRGDIFEIQKIFSEGFRIEMVIVGESGKEEGTVSLGYRLQKHQSGWVPNDVLKRFAADRPANNNEELARAA